MNFVASFLNIFLSDCSIIKQAYTEILHVHVSTNSFIINGGKGQIDGGGMGGTGRGRRDMIREEREGVWRDRGRGRRDRIGEEREGV